MKSTLIPAEIRQAMEAEQAELRSFEERPTPPVSGDSYERDRPDEKIERLTDFMEASEEWMEPEGWNS